MVLKKKEEVEESDESDEDLTEVEDSDDSEFVEEILEGDFEVNDFSIGDIGLATSNVGTFWKGNLESSLVDEFKDNWEERHEEREENSFYQGSADERGRNVYSEIEHGSDFYTGSGKGIDLYAPDSGNYNARDESGEFYDPRIGKRADVEEVRQADKSKLEITGLRGGFGQGTEKDIRSKREDKKYNN